MQFAPAVSVFSTDAAANCRARQLLADRGESNVGLGECEGKGELSEWPAPPRKAGYGRTC